MRTHVRPFLLLLAAALFPAPGAAQCTGGVTIVMQGTHNPFLAGQPAGTTSKQDTAPAASPFLVLMTVAGGDRLQFLNVSGDVHNDPSCCGPGPDGQDDYIGGSASDLGISGYSMPMNCLLGVFLPDQVNGGAAPPSLDFVPAAAKDSPVYSPAIFQTFFIGDGLRLDGVTVQEWVVPPNATRLFLGSSDGFGWSNNSGSFQLTVNKPGSMVACPPAISLASGGTQTFKLDGGVAVAGMPYLVLGTLSGTEPGFPVDGLVLPLNLDGYFTYTLTSANAPPLSNSFGALDTLGKGTASITVPPATNPAFAGIEAHHAFVAIDVMSTAGAAVVVFASNAVGLTFFP